jgi:hypothetical protein
MKNSANQNCSGSFFNTLGQNGTQNIPDHRQIRIAGRGSELRDNKTIKKRAKRKLIMLKVILALIDVAKLKGANHRVRAYWNSYHCMNRLYQVKSKLHTNYCGTRFCTICCGIRKAELINRYKPEISKWGKPYFVTLTVKAVPAYRLSQTMDNMFDAFRKIKERCKQRSRRGSGLKIKGIKSLECNFNPVKRTYNPHFHLIVPSKLVADLLIKEWLSYWTNSIALRDAQDARPVKDVERDLVELIKYSSKTFTEPDTQRKSGKKSKPKIYASALDNIFEAFRGHRIFDRFGFSLPKQAKTEAKVQWVTDFQEWQYNMAVGDWVGDDVEATLSGYTPTAELLNLLDTDIDTAVA